MKALKLRQVCLFFIAFIPINKLFLLPSLLARSANEDMWICTAINIIVDLLTVSVLTVCARKTNTDIFTMVENALGKVGAKILFFVYALFFMLKAILPIIEEKTYIEITLYEVFPKHLMFLPFFIVAFYLCIKKLRAVGRTSDIVWISTLVGLILLFALSIANCDFTALLPVGANGVSNVLKGARVGFIWHGDAIYLAFFLGQFYCHKKGAIKIFLSFLGGAICVLLFMVLFYGIFRSIAHRQIFALTDISKYSTVISNIARFDYLGIIALLFSGVFALTVPLYFAVECLMHIFSFKSRVLPSLIVNGLTFIAVILLRENYYGLESFAAYIGSYLSLFFCNVLPLFIPLLLRRSYKYEYTKN
ncbi:MAG: GerAB/ArcD/ProY family transporter [Clostridia bacterium]|nr:GerAB/ArcD/ProY family transporter [Clostridia bacterium]